MSRPRVVIDSAIRVTPKLRAMPIELVPIDLDFRYLSVDRGWRQFLRGFQEAVESLILVVPPLDQVVGDLDQIGDTDRQLWQPFQLEKSSEDFLGDVLGGIGGQ